MAGLLALVVMISALAVGSLPPRALAQTADDLTADIAAKQAEAAHIADQVEELGARASIAVEEYRQAEAREDAADAALFETRRHVEALRRAYDDARADADERIAAMYRGETAPDPAALLDTRNLRELGAGQHYVGLVARRDRNALDRLDARREALHEEEERLEAQRDELAVQAEALEARGQEAEVAMAGRQHALDAARGELADLVAEEQRRRQAEEEARAREEARRRAEEEARRRAASPAVPVRGGGAAAAPVDPVATAEPPPVHPRAGEAVDAAVAKIGTPYRWGGNGPDAYDCSGLTSYAWGSVGVRLPRSSGMQKRALPPVPMDALQPGDLVFFGTPVHHVGIYMGDGKMVNAPFTGTEVRVDSIYRHDYAGAGRPG